jgi:hypothetical protein
VSAAVDWDRLVDRHAIAHEYLDVAERLSDAAMCRFSFLPG